MGFKEGFVWGAATASYQNEGGYMEDGKGLSIWDTFSHQPGKIEDGRNGDVASDQYHRMDRDIAIMKEMGLNAYRFSLSWPRIMPDGTGRINPKGLDFYDRMVDRLLENGLEPYITLFHWDLPRELYLRGGWMNPDIPKWFAEYAQVVVDRLSDRVTCWITQNEPQCYIGQGLFSGNHAPGIRLAKKRCPACRTSFPAGPRACCFRDQGLCEEKTCNRIRIRFGMALGTGNGDAGKY